MEMKNTYTAVPTEALEDAREWQELKYISDKARENREAEVAARRKASRKLEYERTAKAKRITEWVNLICIVCIWITGSAGLLILTSMGAIAGWLMQIALTAWTGCAGYQVGVLFGCCQPRRRAGERL